MRLQDIFESTTNFVKKAIDPALMTFDEYYNLINPGDKFHEGNAYRWSMNDNLFYKKYKKSDYPKLLNRIDVQGLKIEFRLKTEDRMVGSYVKTDESGEVVRDQNGNALYFTREELENGAVPNLLKNRYAYEIGMFDKEQFIGGSQDEWGCMLLHIADEYQSLGLGPLLSKMAREYDPVKQSGGFTSSGLANFKKTYINMVKNYLQSGMYSYLVMNGQISKEKVKEILSSVNLKTTKKTKLNLNSDDQSDWLLYVGDGDFIIYDRKLKDIIDTERDYFIEKMIKGIVYAYGKEYSRIKVFGGDTDSIKKYLMILAAIDAKNDGLKLLVEPNDMLYVDEDKIKIIDKTPTLKYGYKSQLVEFKGNPMNLKSLGIKERKFRKSFDKYDEFKNLLLEIAYGKYE